MLMKLQNEVRFGQKRRRWINDRQASLKGYKREAEMLFK